MKTTFKIFVPAFACLFSLHLLAYGNSGGDFSERVRIATLNGGIITNEYSDSAKGIRLKDSGRMGGIYAQWVEHGVFQANCFFYYSPQVNYSKVTGYHANADFYFLKSSFGTCVAGADAEGIRIRMDASDNISGLENFKMTNNVLFMMARAGYKFKANPSERVSFSFFPYAGATRETVDGDITLNPAGPPMFTPEMKIDISRNENFFSWGANATVKAFHFIELTAKYLAREMDSERLSSYTFQANFYFPKNITVTYQYKKMELSSGYDAYHLVGAGCYF